jgi:hypothetical protein
VFVCVCVCVYVCVVCGWDKRACVWDKCACACVCVGLVGVRRCANLHTFTLQEAPDYYNVIKTPVDLKLIGERVRDKVYASREQFFNDFNQVHGTQARARAEVLLLTLASSHLCRCLTIAASSTTRRQSSMLPRMSSSGTSAAGSRAEAMQERERGRKEVAVH